MLDFYIFKGAAGREKGKRMASDRRVSFVEGGNPSTDSGRQVSVSTGTITGQAISRDPVPVDCGGLCFVSEVDVQVTPTTKTAGGIGQPSSSFGCSGRFRKGTDPGFPDSVDGTIVSRLVGLPDSLKVWATVGARKDSAQRMPEMGRCVMGKLRLDVCHRHCPFLGLVFPLLVRQ